jgi:hypothetical protein
MKNKMTFIKWLYTNIGKNTPVADLAQDAKDARVPETGDFNALRKSMQQHGNFDTYGPIYDTVQDAKRGYRNHMRKLNKGEIK